MSTSRSIPISVFALAALTALGPFSVDTYLPAMPNIASALSSNIHQVELSLSLYLAGFAIGQLIGGPLSDKLGRRFCSLTGLLIFVLASVLITFTQSIHGLWFGRVIQALGGGLAVVNAAAIIRDCTSGKDSARLLAHIAIITMAAPLLAPAIGTLILGFSDWRGIFFFLLLYSLIVLAVFYAFLPETRKTDPGRQALSLLNRYTSVLTHKKALSYIASQCLAYGGMFAFITASPFVYIQYFGVSQTLYPMLFGANIIFMLLANRINVFLLAKYDSPTLLSIGQTLQCMSSCALLAYLFFAPQPELYYVVVLIMFYVGSHGFVTPNSTACTVEFFPFNSGTAAALIGALSFLTGAIAGAAVSFLANHTPLPMAGVMAFCAIFAIFIRAALSYAGKNSDILAAAN